MRMIIFNDIDIKNYCKNNLTKDMKNKRYICPFCKSGSRKDSALKLYEKTNSFYCFSCKEAGDVFKLHGYLYGMEYIDAKKDLLGDNYKNYKQPKNLDLDNKIKNFEEHEPLNVYDYNSFKQKNSSPTLLNMREFLIDNISFDTIKKFKLQYKYNKYYSKKEQRIVEEKQIIIPVFDYKGRMIGADVRNFGYDYNNCKYRPYNEFVNGKLEIYRIKKSENLFGIYQNKEIIEKTKEVMICESQKAVMQSTTYGYRNTLGLCGSNLSYYQIHMLNNMGVKKIILALDREFDTNKQTYVGEDGIQHKSYLGYMYDICKMSNMIKKIIPDAQIFLMQDLKGNYKKGAYLNYKDAPTDKNKEIFWQLYKTKKPITQCTMEKFFNDKCKKMKYVK